MREQRARGLIENRRIVGAAAGGRASRASPCPARCRSSEWNRLRLIVISVCPRARRCRRRSSGCWLFTRTVRDAGRRPDVPTGRVRRRPLRTHGATACRRGWCRADRSRARPVPFVARDRSVAVVVEVGELIPRVVRRILIRRRLRSGSARRRCCDRAG